MRNLLFLKDKLNVFVLLGILFFFLAIAKVSFAYVDCGAGYSCINRDWTQCTNGQPGTCGWQWGTQYFAGVCEPGSPNQGQDCYSTSQSCCMPGQNNCPCYGQTCTQSNQCQNVQHLEYTGQCQLGSYCTGGGPNCFFCQTPQGPQCEPDHGACLPFGSQCNGWDDSYACQSGYRCCSGGIPTATPVYTTPIPTSTPRPACPYSCTSSSICNANGGTCRGGYYCQVGCCCDFGGGATDTPVPPPTSTATPPPGATHTPTPQPPPPNPSATPTAAPATYRISGRYINIGLSPVPASCGTAVGTSYNLNGNEVFLYPGARSTFTEYYPVGVTPPQPGAFLFYNVPNGVYSLGMEIPPGLSYYCSYSPTNGSVYQGGPTVAVNGGNVPLIKMVFREPTPTRTPTPTVTPTRTPTPTSTPTPTATPIPQGPWIKLKNTSLQTRNTLYSQVPSTPAPFLSGDIDDLADSYFNSEDTTNNQIDVGVISASDFDPIYPSPDSLSLPKWKIVYGSFNRQFDPSTFYQYIKARKEFKDISQSPNCLLDITQQNGALYYYNPQGACSQRNIASPPNGTKSVIIVNGDFYIQNGGGGNFNVAPDDSPQVPFAVIADTIHFAPDVQKAYGIFIANSIDTGNSNLGLKIKGNLVSLSGNLFSDVKNSLSRTRTPGNLAPAIFIVNYPKTYIDLLPYLSISLYDWKELSVKVGLTPSPTVTIPPKGLK